MNLFQKVDRIRELILVTFPFLFFKIDTQRPEAPNIILKTKMETQKPIFSAQRPKADSQRPKVNPKAKNILLEAQNQRPMDETTPRLKSTPSDQNILRYIQNWLPDVRNRYFVALLETQRPKIISQSLKIDSYWLQIDSRRPTIVSLAPKIDPHQRPKIEIQ